MQLLCCSEELLAHTTLLCPLQVFNLLVMVLLTCLCWVVKLFPSRKMSISAFPSCCIPALMTSAGSALRCLKWDICCVLQDCMQPRTPTLGNQKVPCHVCSWGLFGNSFTEDFLLADLPVEKQHRWLRRGMCWELAAFRFGCNMIMLLISRMAI